MKAAEDGGRGGDKAGRGLGGRKEAVSFSTATDERLVSFGRVEIHSLQE